MKLIFLKKHIALFLCMAVLMICPALSSCGKVPPKEADNIVTFTDSLGQTISIEKNPQRVAALLGSFADVWMLSGGELCAAAEDAFDDFGLDLPDAVCIGGAHSPSLELLLSSDPDLVIASASTASHVEMREALASLGIPIVYFDVDNFDEYLAMLDICTEITGRKDLYKTNGTDIRDQIETIKERYREAEIPEQERSVLLLRASSTSIKAKGSVGTILGEMLADIGCVNIADSDNSLLEQLSVEAVIRKEPHHIFVVAMGGSTEKAQTAIETMIKEDPAWRSLQAVQDGRLHIMEKTLFNLKPNAKWAKAYEKLYETLTTP